MSTNDADTAVDQPGCGVSHGRVTAHRGCAGVEPREDLRVDHVQLSLDLVAPDVMGRAHVFIQDQMFRPGWKPTKTRPTGQMVTFLHKCDLQKGQTSPSRSCIDPCSGPALGPRAPPAPGRPRTLPSDIWRTPQIKTLITAGPTRRGVTCSAAAHSTRPPRRPQTDTPRR